MDKITDWAEVVADKIVTAAHAYLESKGLDTSGPLPFETVESAFELVLSQSCAGPKTIRIARQKLGIA